jgi:hypothetical protein
MEELLKKLENEGSWHKIKSLVAKFVYLKNRGYTYINDLNWDVFVHTCSIVNTQVIVVTGIDTHCKITYQTKYIIKL